MKMRRHIPSNPAELAVRKAWTPEDMDILRSGEAPRAAEPEEGRMADAAPASSPFYGVCLEAVKENGYALEAVPEAMRSREMCLAAVGRDGPALQFVPMALRDAGMCMAAVRTAGETGAWNVLRHVPASALSAAIALEAVLYGERLEAVPERLRTPEVCLAAVKADGGQLEFVPASVQTPALRRTAVSRHGWALKFVPKEDRTPELCAEAAASSWSALEYVPDGLKTEEMCLACIRQDGMAFAFVPEALKTEAVCAEAVRRSPHALEFVPDAVKTERMCRRAVMQKDCWMLLKFVPAAVQALMPDLLQEAVEASPANLGFVAESLRTEDMCLKAVRAFPYCMQWVPERVWRGAAAGAKASAPEA